ncbi:hypothetical protein Cni_G24916 [Canna indica]|uniref:Cystatin domain-containing protein n=1 Tax=Canna indica TaxID=4628 RepID=A0AAQ3KWL6_9LILI|nr:hypothetical protein Cni_G24916 [Canna indica]
MMASLDRYLFLQFLLLSSLLVSVASAFGGRKVGGWTEIKDVETNKEVQDLGQFSVHEYNHRLRLNDGGEPLLTFSGVVAAQRQVVSGIKYYLRVAAAEDGAANGVRTFDAVVIVKPWLDSRTLVSFTPRRPETGGEEAEISVSTSNTTREEKGNEVVHNITMLLEASFVITDMPGVFAARREEASTQPLLMSSSSSRIGSSVIARTSLRLALFMRRHGATAENGTFGDRGDRGDRGELGATAISKKMEAR